MISAEGESEVAVVSANFAGDAEVEKTMTLK